MKKEILQNLESLTVQGVQGAYELLTSTEKLLGQQFQSRMTEAFAVYFIVSELKLKVTQIETSQKILSPHRKKDKSCDIKCEDLRGSELFLKLKIREGIRYVRSVLVYRDILRLLVL